MITVLSSANVPPVLFLPEILNDPATTSRGAVISSKLLLAITTEVALILSLVTVNSVIELPSAKAPFKVNV